MSADFPRSAGELASIACHRFASFACIRCADFVSSAPVRGRNDGEGMMRAAYLYGMHCAVLLAGCFGAQAGQLADDPGAPWILGLPISNSFAAIVVLDADPSGAEATTSLGGACRTPCSLEVSAEGS